MKILGYLFLSVLIGFSVALAAQTGEPIKATARTGGNFEVEAIKDVAYYEGENADPDKHKLDLYVPKGQKGFPVLLFAHGGGWKNGDKKEFEFLGKALAENGIGVLCINYRLYPQVRFPANVENVAKAFAWAYQNIAKHGGRADQLFVGGHSSGGHLVSLLATNESYLKVERLAPTDIRGVVSISGLYLIPRGRFPLFEDSDEGAKKASPIQQIKGNHPPFLLVYADQDFPRFGAMADEFANALQLAKCDVKCLNIKDRTHGSVVAKIGEDGDPVRQATLEFVEKYSKMKVRP